MALLTQSMFSVIALMSLCLYRIYRVAASGSITPKGVSWVGRRKEVFSYLRAKARALFGTKATLMEAYTQFNKLGKAVLIPLPFSRPEVVLPPSSIRWIITQPELAMSPTPIHDEITQVRYAFLNPQLVGDHTVYNVLRRDMMKHLKTLVPIMDDEISAALDDVWGLGTDWRPVSLFDTMREVVLRVSTRVFIGEPLCYNEDYLRNSSKLSSCVIPSGLLLCMFPDFIKPVASKFTTFFNRIYVSRCARYLQPVMRQRLADVEAMNKDPNGRPALPNDLITWLVEDSLHRGEPRKGLENLLIGRLFMANFAAIETTTMTITSTLFDIMSSSPTKKFAGTLREEALNMFETSNGQPKKEDLMKMIRTDSAMKETLRLHAIFKALAREVTAPKGLTMENGLHLPKGSRVCISSHGLHNDESIYPNATTYDAFRYSRVLEQPPAAAENGTESAPKPLSQSLAATSEVYLPFGHGKHSCPGRFFAADEMKLVFAYIFAKYEIMPIEEKRSDLAIGFFPTPAFNGPIRIRRRPETVHS